MARVPIARNIGDGYQIAKGMQPLCKRVETMLDIHEATMRAFHSGDGDIDLSDSDD